MHCKSWKTILPFAITFLVGSFIATNFEVNIAFSRLISGKTVIKSQNNPTDLKENVRVIARDKAPTMIDCFACIDGKVYKEDETFNKSKPTNKLEKPLVIISKPKADYTESARISQTQGTVSLRVTFFASGQIGNIIAVGLPLPNGLTENAIEAARKIKFEPAMKNGIPQTVTKQVHYTFTLY